MQKQIFLSYSWRNKDIADAIDNDWQSVGITLTRDVRDVQYKGNLKDFMKRVHESDFVLLLISKDYLESKNCMYEALEMFDDPNFKRKILPILTDDAKLSDPFARISYLDYWDTKRQTLDEGYRGMRSAIKAASIVEELQHYDKIRGTWDEFADQIQSILCATWPRTKDIGYSDIFNHIGFNQDQSAILEECRRIVALNDLEEQEMAIEDLRTKHPNNFSVTFTTSSIAYKAERFKVCRRILERLAVAYPSSFQVHSNLGVLLTTEFKEYGESRKYLTKAVELRPDNASALIGLSFLLSEYFEEYDQARAHLEHAIEMEPDNPDAHIRLGKLLANNQQLYSEAKESFQAALAIAPDNKAALLGLARLANQTGTPEEARTLYEQILLSTPGDREALIGLAIILTDDYQLYDEARSLFERILEVEPNDYAANYNLSHLLASHMNLPAIAAEHMRAAIQANPKQAEAYHYLADILSEQPNLREEAKQLYEHALELEPNRVPSLVNLAALLVKEFQDKAVAQTTIERAVALAPDDASVLYNYGAILEKAGKLEEAKMAYERAAELNPDDELTIVAFASSLRKLNLYSQAKKNYQHILEINPRNIIAHYILGNIALEQDKDYKIAQQHFERALEIDPNRADIITNLATAFSLSDDVENALIYFERSLEVDPNIAQTHLNIAFTLFGVPGQETKAREHYLRACELNPTYKNNEDDKDFGV